MGGLGVKMEWTVGPPNTVKTMGPAKNTIPSLPSVSGVLVAPSLGLKPITESKGKARPIDNAKAILFATAFRA